MSQTTDIINDGRNYASTVLNNAAGELDNAMSMVNALGNASPLGAAKGDTFPKFDVSPPKPGDPGAVPQFAGAAFHDPGFDAKDPTNSLDLIPSFVLPQDPGVAPSVVSPGFVLRPSSQPGDETLLQGVPVVSSSDTVPDAPDLLGEIHLIQKPVLLDVTIADAPTFQAPEFLGVAPTDPGAPPTGLDRTQRSEFDRIGPVMRVALSTEFDAFMDREFPSFRAGMATLENRLSTYLAGGTALTPQVEDGIYSRTIDKMNVDAKRARDKALGEAARMGFTVPSQTLLSMLQDIDQDRRNNNARGAIDIAVKQAELEQENIKFAVTQSANLRQIALNAAAAYYSGLVQVNATALEYARDVVGAIVQSYDLSTKYAEVQARIYESQTRVYEAKLQGALAVIQAYEASVRAEEAKVQVDVARVNAYRAQIDAVQAEASVYRSVIDGVVAKAQLERIKVELYQAKVMAYGAQVNAYTAQWQGYEAAVRGESARVQASAEQVRAYTAKVQAYSEEVRAKGIEIDSVARGNESRVRAFQAEVEAYKARVDAQATVVRAGIESYDTTIKAFVAKANAISEHSRAEIAVYEAALRATISEANILLDRVRLQNQMQIAKVDAAARISTSGASIFGGVAQAALSGMNSLAVVSLQESA